MPSALKRTIVFFLRTLLFGNFSAFSNSVQMNTDFSLQTDTTTSSANEIDAVFFEDSHLELWGGNRLRRRQTSAKIVIVLPVCSKESQDELFSR